MSPLDHALGMAALGWRVAPIPAGHKHPHGIDNWQTKATTAVDKLRGHWAKYPDHGVCIVTGAGSGIFAIDIDPDDGGDDSLRALEATYGALPETVESITGGGGRHLLFRWPAQGEIRNSASGALGVGIDVRGTGGQIVVAPTVHPNGRTYHWEVEHNPLDGHPVADAPGWLLELLQTDPRSAEPRRPPRRHIDGDGVLPGVWWSSLTDWPTELARYAWSLHSAHNDASGNEYELWTRPGKSIRDGASASLYYGGSDVLKVFSSNAEPLRAEETYTLWGFHVAMEHGGDFESAARVVGAAMRNEQVADAQQVVAADNGVEGVAGQSIATPDEPIGPDGYHYTDTGNAKRLSAKHGDAIRFVSVWKSWLVYARGRWHRDHARTLINHLAAELAEDLRPHLARYQVGTAERKKLTSFITRCENVYGINCTVVATQSIPGIAIDHEAIDRDPWLLNVRNGTVDLRTGQLRAHDHRDLMMMQADVDYEPDAPASRWLSFLEQMQPDEQVRALIQRLMGLALVGQQLEHVLAVNIGNGANGKSVFTYVIDGVLGDYSIAANRDLLLTHKNSQHPTAKASLFRRRLAHLGELPQGARLDEAQVKELTGGDRVTARRMHEDEWNFTPSHLLWVHANHRPRIEGTDDGIWRRVHLIPWSVQIAEADRDPQLAATILHDEGAGVLGWMLAGLKDYLDNGGLRPPPTVKAATESYRRESDTIADFITNAGVVLDSALDITSNELMRAHGEWFASAGISGNERDHYQRLTAHLTANGATKAKSRTKGGHYWRGVGITDDDTAPTGANPSLLRQSQSDSLGDNTAGLAPVGAGNAVEVF